MAESVITICFFVLIDVDNYHNIFNDNVELTVLRAFLGENPKQTRGLIMVYKIHYITLFIVRMNK